MSEPIEELSFEDRVAAIVALITKQPLHREILFRALGFCRERRDLPDIEREIASYPEFKYCAQDQYHLIGFLENAGGLERLELDAGGEVVTDDRTAGLSEDEIDDLVVSFAFVTTEAGTAAHEELDPGRRIRELLDDAPARTRASLRVLEFCHGSRTYQEIEDLLEDPDAGLYEMAEEDAVHASFVVSGLEAAGALVWDGGWLLSDHGRAVLESRSNAL